MTTSINNFGELVTKWQSHKHPENPKFMQVVYWCIFEKNGKTTICWHLGNPSNSHFIYDMSKAEVIAKFTDTEEITEESFQEWLKLRK